jgi:hypothetical protein
MAGFVTVSVESLKFMSLASRQTRQEWRRVDIATSAAHVNLSLFQSLDGGDQGIVAIGDCRGEDHRRTSAAADEHWRFGMGFLPSKRKTSD